MTGVIPATSKVANVACVKQHLKRRIKNVNYEYLLPSRYIRNLLERVAYIFTQGPPLTTPLHEETNNFKSRSGKAEQGNWQRSHYAEGSEGARNGGSSTYVMKYKANSMRQAPQKGTRYGMSISVRQTT